MATSSVLVESGMPYEPGGNIEDLIPTAVHDTTQYANNGIEADHGRLKAGLRPMHSLKRDGSARVVISGHAFVQNLRRGHYKLGVDARPPYVCRQRSASSPTPSELAARYSPASVAPTDLANATAPLEVFDLSVHDLVADLGGLEPMKVSAVRVVADPVDLRRALANLVQNACRAAGPAGHVEVHLVQDERVRIEVHDSGPGFGAGPSGIASLGLGIVRRVADEHGGTVTLAESPSGGTCVRLELPRVPDLDDIDLRERRAAIIDGASPIELP